MLYNTYKSALRKLRIQVKFKRKNGYWCSFKNPKTYAEKLNYRKIYGNETFYSSVADKYAVREYVEHKVGGKYLVNLYGVYDNLTEDIVSEMPNKFIIKATHGSKWNKIVHSKSEIDFNETCSRFNKFLRKKYGKKCFEWYYNCIKPKVVIEELLYDNGEIPFDYNFYCYNYRGNKPFDFVLSVSSSDHKRSAHFDRNWNLLEGNLLPEEMERSVKPPNYAEMVEVAAKLSSDFDFVRVDLYNVRGKIYFGELTCVPGGGFGEISNEERRRMRDEMWELDRDNRLLYRNSL